MRRNISIEYPVPSTEQSHGRNDKQYPLTTTEVNMSGNYYVSRDFARYSLLDTRYSVLKTRKVLLHT
jgi:hypothetical protein